jgi:hypothetical protein
MKLLDYICLGVLVFLSVREQAAFNVINIKLKELVKRQYELTNSLSIHNGSSLMNNTPFGIKKERKKGNIILQTDHC